MFSFFPGQNASILTECEDFSFVFPLSNSLQICRAVDASYQKFSVCLRWSSTVPVEVSKAKTRHSSQLSNRADLFIAVADQVICCHRSKLGGRRPGHLLWHGGSKSRSSQQAVQTAMSSIVWSRYKTQEIWGWDKLEIDWLIDLLIDWLIDSSTCSAT